MTPGAGFLEKVYEKALNIELNKRGMKAQQQAPLKVYYKCELVGDYTKLYLFFVTFCHREDREHRDAFSVPNSHLCVLCDLCGNHIEFQITLIE